jgi:hypothetical protein
MPGAPYRALHERGTKVGRCKRLHRRRRSAPSARSARTLTARSRRPRSAGTLTAAAVAPLEAAGQVRGRSTAAAVAQLEAAGDRPRRRLLSSKPPAIGAVCRGSWRRRRRLPSSKPLARSGDVDRGPARTLTAAVAQLETVGQVRGEVDRDDGCPARCRWRSTATTLAKLEAAGDRCRRPGPRGR